MALNITLKKLNLNIEIFDKNTTFDNIKTMLSNIKEEDIMDLLFVDAREIDVSNQLDKISSVSAEYNSSKKFLKRNKISVLVNKPVETAAAMLYKQKNINQFAVNIFSSIDEAINYLDLNDHKDIILKYIKEE